MELELANLREGYVELLDYVLREGQFVTSRGLPTRELTGVQVTFIDPLAPLLPVHVGRRVNLRLAALEALSLIGGVDASSLIQRTVSGYARVLVDPDHPGYGAYGPRVATQLGAVAQLLTEEPTTRRAVISIWREDDLEHVGDRPCTVFLQFMIRPSEPGGEAQLELYVTMRSQDVWLGVPYDVFMFSQLQHTLARELRVPAGRYVHRVTSLHLYETNVEAAEAIVAAFREDPTLPPCDDLPLGVVAVESESDERGFDVASYLLDDAEFESSGVSLTATDAERAANAWYVARLEELNRG